MEQYKVILVDDEVEVIDVMKKKIRWNDLGFDVVGSATNGVKALELVEKLQPDVVLTDIKCARINFIETAHNCQIPDNIGCALQSLFVRSVTLPPDSPCTENSKHFAIPVSYRWLSHPW